MTIPDFQSIMLPLLESVADGEQHALRKVIENLAKKFDLTQDEIEDLLPSGSQRIFL